MTDTPQTIKLTILEPDYPERWRHAPELYLPALVTYYTDSYDAIVTAKLGDEYSVECSGWPDNETLAAEIGYNLRSVWYETINECDMK